MTILTILEFPDPRLRTTAKTVTTIDSSVRSLIDSMFETMYDAKGIGLAATQVNIHQRIVVMDIADEGSEPLVMINPQLEVLADDSLDYDEGCLSVPGFYELVTRPEKIRLTALDRDGNEYTLEPDGLLAICIQHEIDHLNGKLFVDHISTMKRQRIRAKLVKLHRQQDK
jgi:peptide deformylase